MGLTSLLTLLRKLGLYSLVPQVWIRTFKRYSTPYGPPLSVHMVSKTHPGLHLNICFLGMAFNTVSDRGWRRAWVLPAFLRPYTQSDTYDIHRHYTNNSSKEAYSIGSMLINTSFLILTPKSQHVWGYSWPNGLEILLLPRLQLLMVGLGSFCLAHAFLLLIFST
jgi:hypothetical protein